MLSKVFIFARVLTMDMRNTSWILISFISSS